MSATGRDSGRAVVQFACWTQNSVASIPNHMVNGSADLLDSTFAALANRTRRALLDQLSEGESTVTELAEPFEMSLPAVSKHLTVLEQAGLVVRRKDGRLRRCELAAAPMSAAAGWIETYRAFWEEQLDRLEDFLESDIREDDGR